MFCAVIILENEMSDKTPFFDHFVQNMDGINEFNANNDIRTLSEMHYQLLSTHLRSILAYLSFLPIHRLLTNYASQKSMISN